MKRVFLVGWLVVALVLAGCNAPWMSGNSASDSDSKSYTRTYSKDRTSDTDILSENTVKLIDVSVDVDNRDFSTTEVNFETCHSAVQTAVGSCGIGIVPAVEVPK